MQKWEYLEISLTKKMTGWYWSDTDKPSKNDPVNQHLTAYGLQGWELVSATSADEGGWTMYFYYLLKRPVG